MKTFCAADEEFAFLLETEPDEPIAGCVELVPSRAVRFWDFLIPEDRQWLFNHFDTCQACWQYYESLEVGGDELLE